MNKYLKLKLSDYKINLEERPETYKTVLRKGFGNNTETFKLRRKLSILVKEGHITNAPIYNFLKARDVIFFTINKNYYIVFANNDCYYCSEIKSNERNIEIKDCYALRNYKWIKCKDRKFNLSEVITCL